MLLDVENQGEWFLEEYDVPVDEIRRLGVVEKRGAEIHVVGSILLSFVQDGAGSALAYTGEVDALGGLLFVEDVYDTKEYEGEHGPVGGDCKYGEVEMRCGASSICMRWTRTLVFGQ